MVLSNKQTKSKMKNLLLLLLFIPLVSFGQDKLIIQSKTNVSSSTNIENELVLSDEKTTIKTPLTADLSNYSLSKVKENGLIRFR